LRSLSNLGTQVRMILSYLSRMIRYIFPKYNKLLTGFVIVFTGENTVHLLSPHTIFFFFYLGTENMGVKLM